MNENQDKMFNKTSINWYPGHMAKTKRLIKENLNLIDIIFEVIDARIPISSKITDIDELINNKPRVLVMTKYDLCDKSETNKFIKDYESLRYYVFPCDLINMKDIDRLYDLSYQILEEKIKKMNNKGINKSTIRALVIGIPNVGKSTLINKLIGFKRAEVGNKPGVTKNLNWIKGKKGIELLDTPGILWPKLEQDIIAFNLASMTAINENILPKQDVVIYILKYLYKYYPHILKEQYGVDDIKDIELTFDLIGKKKGYLEKGGIVNYDKVITLILNDIKQGKIKNITFDRYDNVK